MLINNYNLVIYITRIVLYIITFYLYQYPKVKKLLYPFYRKRNWGSEELSNDKEVIESRSSHPEMVFCHIKIHLPLKLCYCLPCGVIESNFSSIEVKLSKHIQSPYVSIEHIWLTYYSFQQQLFAICTLFLGKNMVYILCSSSQKIKIKTKTDFTN